MDAASLIRLFLLAAIWGGSFLFMRVGVSVFGPGPLIAWRILIAAIVLWLAGLWLRKRLELHRLWKHFLFIGLFNSALPFLLFAYAAQSLSASLLAILNATSPLFGAVIARLYLRTPLDRFVMLGLLCGLGGVAVLVGNGISLTSGGGTAIVAGLMAPCCYGLSSTYTKAHPSSATAFDNAHGSMWMAALIVLPLLIFLPTQKQPLAEDWAVVLALGILCTGIAYLLYFRLIQDLGPTRALSVTFLIPVFGVLWGVLFLDERIGWDTTAGGLLVLTGIALTNGLIKQPEYAR
jgi:drug/metabolite transporter (DMT)-like permease